jgi:hypothetical protein
MLPIILEENIFETFVIYYLFEISVEKYSCFFRNILNIMKKP